MGRVTSRTRASSSDLAPRFLRYVDSWLPRFAHLSQIALVALGVIGYVYTVLPLYQKALLDEEIARKTLELNAKEHQNSELSRLIGHSSDELRELKSQLVETQRKVSAAQDALRRAEHQASVAIASQREALLKQEEAESSAKAALNEAEVQYTTLRQEVVRNLAARIPFCILVPPSKPRLLGLDEGAFRQCIESHLAGSARDLQVLRKQDAESYRRIALQLLEQFEPQYRAHAARMNKLEADLIAEDDRIPPNTGKRAFWSKLGPLSTERLEGYNRILKEVSDRLVRDVGQ